MKNKHIIIILISILFGSLCSAVSYWICFKNKGSHLAFVRTGVIFQEYKGMQEANEKFNKEIGVVQGNLDTLRNRFERLKIRLGNKESHELQVAGKEYEEYNQRSANDLEQRKQQLTQEVVQEINNSIQAYGRSKGYTLILGSTNDGSILYGEEALDITKYIIAELNKQYNNKKGKQDGK